MAELLSKGILSWCPEIEPRALQQLHNLAALPFMFKHIAVMPDCHVGKGATVGSVIATSGAIVPAAVGVDIGCGMLAVKTPLTASCLPDSLKELYDDIERRIPLGAGGRNQKLSYSAETRATALGFTTGSQVYLFQREPQKWGYQLGTLGSGNHFIEVCLDETNQVWVVLHSGSRGIGNQLAQHHIRIAQALMETWFIALPDEDLAYLPGGTKQFHAYIQDLLWAQNYASANRNEMMDRVLTALSCIIYKEEGHEIELEDLRINCHHNFTQQEQHFGHIVWVTRKGAIQMEKGQLGVIPGSMGTSTYIVEGLGNRESFNSAPHGAGRRLSRNEARKQYNLEDLTRAMAGIECRVREALVDEIPGAYKDIDEVIAHSRDLVVVKHTLRQILNIKGD